ncbi:aminotransferase class V-fold PLP-dependent enzyme [Kineosporia sp. J2-2]|uniref:Aminotransferase class V-fold PLP-dependent enzyme n=1 Tax=Kineosporia corallincola TaxID=2835133 RepID=A0ABS5TS30_9ACTN|nr:aminotransferase class V-fold PLP-dependent enzyme [Kineosporia corallincola]MBT0773600.1 aminotransferase class V-fold PLP-dependent enzyme [Kineosporia corallincola]
MESSLDAGPAVLQERAVPVDVAAERARTPGTAVAHHFNAAGAALPSAPVVQSVVDHLRLEEQIGGYEAAHQVADRIEDAYRDAARLLNADPGEIALFDSASTGLRTIIDALRLGTGHRLLVSRSTYVSHALHLMSLGREHDVELVVVPNGPDGAVDLEALDLELAGGAPAILCVAHIPTSSGLVEPVAEIGALARRYGARYVLDATQSVGQLALDVTRIGCDALVTTGRKFLRAPRGTGFAYVGADLVSSLAPTAPDVRGAVWTSSRKWELKDGARRFETWEASIAGRIGLGVALAEALELGTARTEDHLVTMAAGLRETLGEIPAVTVQDPPASPSAIVTFTVDGKPARQVNERLAAHDVRTVSVPASHAQWDLGARGVDAVVRASPHVYTDGSDMSALIDAVTLIAQEV